ncbi:MAG: DUF2085 domain-containing protein [candidate division Zixibacteria bacterium]|nr:DUF2085 domain-containing protein [candidate division Zixibacteria bacterium]
MTEERQAQRTDKLIRTILVWSLTLLTGLYFSGGIIPPLFFLSDSGSVNAWHAFYGYFCHQIPERSFFIDSCQLGFCSRCTGFFGALFLASLAILVLRARLRIHLLMVVVLIIPLLLDFIFDFSSALPAANLSRLIIGAVAGFGLTAGLFPRYLALIRR